MSKNKKTHNNSISITSSKLSSKLNKTRMQTSMNSPRKHRELIMKLQNEINVLKNTIKSQSECIQGLKNELTVVKTTQTESNEYEEYAKKQLMRNVEILSKENCQLREEIEKYKSKVVKMMKLLYNMSKKGISVDVMVDCAEEDVNDTHNDHNNKDDDIQLLETQMSNLSSTTFTPLNFPDDENVKNVVYHTQLPSNAVVPKLKLELFNKTKCYESENKQMNIDNNNVNSHELFLDVYRMGNNERNDNEREKLKKSSNSFVGNKQLNKSVNCINSNNKLKLMTLNGIYMYNNANSNSGHQRNDSNKYNSSKNESLSFNKKK